MSLCSSTQRCAAILAAAAATLLCHSTANAQAPAGTSQPASAVSQAQVEQVVAELIKAGQASAEEFRTQGGRWAMLCSPPGKEKTGLLVGRMVSKSRRLWTFCLRSDHEKEILRIVEDGGVWYVKELDKKPAKYRPYSAVFAMPNAYSELTASEPQFVTKDNLKNLTFLEASSDMVLFRSPYSRLRIWQFEDTFSEVQARVPTADVQREVQKTRELIKQGTPVFVKRQSGTFFSNGNDNHVYSEVMKPLAKDEKLLDISRETWDDRTGDLSAGNPDDLALVRYASCSKPDDPDASDFQSCVVNVKNGSLRRVPFPGPFAISQCFLPGRKKVVVVAPMPDDASNWGLFSVDLSSGTTGQIGAEKLSAGIVGYARLSPDGKRLLAMLRDPMPARDLIRGQICIIDLANDKVRELSTGRYARALWLSDEELLVEERGEGSPADKTPPPLYICRMDMKGKLRRIREGYNVVLLPDGKTIAFQNKNELWRTCDLEGINEKPFGDGYSGLGAPAFSPDGKRMLMPRVDSDCGLELFDVGKAAGTRLPFTKTGGWRDPVWR